VALARLVGTLVHFSSPLTIYHSQTTSIEQRATNNEPKSTHFYSFLPIFCDFYSLLPRFSRVRYVFDCFFSYPNLSTFTAQSAKKANFAPTIVNHTRSS
jgi:hypothetical protein